MQRLVLAVLLLAVVAALGAVFALGVRAVNRQGNAVDHRREAEGMMPKLAYSALILLLAGASLGLLGGL